MFGKLTHVPIIVQDQDRALKFYTEKLGFVKVADTQQEGRPRWLTVAIPGTDLEFILVKGDYVEDPRDAATVRGGNHWVLRTNDCKADVKALKAKGVKFKGDIQEARWGINAYLTDSEGNHITLVQPPGGM